MNGGSRSGYESGQHPSEEALVLLTDEQLREALGDEAARRVRSFRDRLGLTTVRLSPVEFRIVTFLAARPYQAFTPERIAEATSVPGEAVTVESLPSHIEKLRNKLGLLSDYIQSVPHIGFRFKA